MNNRKKDQPMADVNISINGRIYEIGCDQGQEGRIVDLAAYIDSRLQQIARSGAAYNDAHLMVLTTLVLADELFELRESASSRPAARAEAAPAAAPVAVKPESAPGLSKEDEAAVAKLIEQMTKRIDGIAAKMQAA